MRLTASALSAAIALTCAPGVQSAHAVSCPQVEVVFARGRVEPPGTGRIGEAFIDAVRARTSKNVGYYAVDYPADTEVVQGANDMAIFITMAISSASSGWLFSARGWEVMNYGAIPFLLLTGLAILLFRGGKRPAAA